MRARVSGFDSAGTPAYAAGLRAHEATVGRVEHRFHDKSTWFCWKPVSVHVEASGSTAVAGSVLDFVRTTAPARTSSAALGNGMRPGTHHVPNAFWGKSVPGPKSGSSTRSSSA